MIEIPADQEATSRQIVDAAFAVHTALGPGLLESVYEQCLTHELRLRNLRVDRQIVLPVHYKDIVVDAGLRLDALVAASIVVEIKAIERILPVHEAQILTYLKLAKKHLGLLINFSVPLIKDGIRRFVA